eukprot:scaffold10.g2477.t1
MEAVLARKPLTDAEKAFPKCTVCVTGGTGFVASHIVLRLLAAGHTVHATYRPGKDDQVTLDWLQALPCASQRLKWFPADLLKEGSFDAAVKGCTYVFHVAGVVRLDIPDKKGMELVVNPKVAGVANVLGAVNRQSPKTVKRVIMTSSLAAVMDYGRPADHGARVFNDQDFNLQWPLAGVPYLSGKTISEWEAWAMEAQQKDWELVCINPSYVFGPPLAPIAAAVTVQMQKAWLDGTMYPYYIPIDFNTVDVRDVAAAHCLAMVHPEARQGRYLLSQTSGQSTHDLSKLLRATFPGYKVPHKALGRFGTRLMIALSPALKPGMLVCYGRTVRLSSDKARAKLGLDLIPLETTMRDAADAFVAAGILQPHVAPRAKK